MVSKDPTGWHSNLHKRGRAGHEFLHCQCEPKRGCPAPQLVVSHLRSLGLGVEEQGEQSWRVSETRQKEAGKNRKSTTKPKSTWEDGADHGKVTRPGCQRIPGSQHDSNWECFLSEQGSNMAFGIISSSMTRGDFKWRYKI